MSELSPQEQLQRLLPHLEELGQLIISPECSKFAFARGSTDFNLFLNRYPATVITWLADRSQAGLSLQQTNQLLEVHDLVASRVLTGNNMHTEDRVGLICALVEQAYVVSSESNRKQWHELALVQYSKLCKIPNPQICLSILDSISKHMTVESILPFLRTSPIKVWQSFSPHFLHYLWSQISGSRDLIARFGEIMPQSRFGPLPPASQARRIWGLHSLYYQQSFHEKYRQMKEKQKKVFAIHHEDTYRVLVYILSSSVLRAYDSGTANRETFELICEILVDLRHRQFPPETQVIAAILHLAYLCTRQQLEHLYKNKFLEWIWLEWSLRRKNDTKQSEDKTMMVGFLNATLPNLSNEQPRESAPLVTSEGDLDSEDVTTFANVAPAKALQDSWSMELLNRAITDAGVSPSALWRRTPCERLNGSPKALHADLLRAIALAAIRLERLDITLDCLHDERLSPAHALSILCNLSQYMQARGHLKLSARKQLAHVIADFVRKLAGKLQPSLPAVRVVQLVPIISMLYFFRYFNEATALILVLRDPLLLGASHLGNFLRIIVFHGLARPALSIYRSMSPEKIGTQHLTALLASRHAIVSDAVWRDLLSFRYEASDAELLHARLRHHMFFSEPSSKLVMEDHANAISIIGIVPTVETNKMLFSVLLKAGKLQKAMQVLERIKDYAATSNTLNRLLLAAQQPRKPWVHHMGPASKLNRVSKTLKSLVEEHNLPVDGITANILLKASLKWGEMDTSAIWSALKAGLTSLETRDWDRELRPLFRMVIRAFLAREDREAAKEAVVLMAQIRIHKIGR